MTLYADASALVKRYVDEPDSPMAGELLASDPLVFTCRISVIEVRRNLRRSAADAVIARARFQDDLAQISLVEIDAQTCELAATIGENTEVRSLDALHLGAARRLGTAVTFLTFDIRQAQAARSLGFAVVGA